MSPLTALLHSPSPRMNEAIRTHVAHEAIDLVKVIEQHAAYRQTLASCGIDVEVLDDNREHPDCVFIEDTAIVLDEIAILASMGAPSRAREPAKIEPALRRFREKVVRIEPPATIEGGDVLRVGRRLLVGVTARTNGKGIAALSEIVRPYGYVVVPVRVSGCLHLKSACTALPDGTLLVNPAWIDLGSVLGFELLGVHEEEPLAANVLSAGDAVIASAQSPGTVAEIARRGFDVRTVDLSELAKADGAVTCPSLVFRTTA